MGTMINGKKWLGACINGEEVNGLVKNGIVFYNKLNDEINYTEYLENQQGEYIDTGIVGNQDTTMIIELMPNEVKAYCGIAGARLSTNNFAFFTGQNVYRAYYRNGNSSSTVALNTTEKAIIKLDKNKFYVNDSLIYEFTYADFSVLNLWLFTVNHNGESFDYTISYKLYNAKIYSNGSLVRDFKPCLDENNKACLYDKVSKQYFYKSGDITPPVYQTLGIFNTTHFNSGGDIHYATNGNNIRVLIWFKEKLEVEPKLALLTNDGYVDLEGNEAFKYSNDGREHVHYYISNFILKDTMNLPEGEIQIKIYDYADAAGNVGETLTNEDINNAQYDYVIFDSIAPEYYSLEILNATRYAQGLNANYAGKNDTIRVSVSFPEQLTVSPQLKIGDKVIEGGLVLNQTKSRTTNLYYYSNNVEITDDMNLVDGDPIPIQVYGYEDIAGNVGETLTNIDIKNTEYTEVIYDISAPQTGISGFPLYTLTSRVSGDNRPYTVIRDGEEIMVEANFTEELAHNPKISLIRNDDRSMTEPVELPYSEKINDKYVYRLAMKINANDLQLENGDMIEFVITDVEDFAGNTATFDNDDVTSIKLDDGREYGQVTYDNTPPTITVKTDATATVGSIENKVFSKVSFSISDGVGLREWQLNNAASQQVTVSKWGDINNVTIDTTGAIEGTNTLKVRDTAGNEATYEFTLTN